MASFTAKGDTLVLFVPTKGETVAVAISGSYNQVINLQVELGALGSGAWQHVKRFDVEDATEAFNYVTRSAEENLRLILSKDDGGTATVTLTDTSNKLIKTIKDTVGNILAAFYQSGPTFAGTLIYSTLNDGTTDLSASVVEMNYLDFADAIGTVEASKAIVVGSDKGLVWATTRSASGDPFTFTNTMTQAGTTGGRALFQMNANAALGGWSSALKAYVVYGASGRTTGRGSALVAEIALSPGTNNGSYSPLESEIVVGSSGSLGTATAFLYCNVVDDGTTFNDGGYLLELGEGIAATAGGLFDPTAKTAIQMTHTLKIKIGPTDYYLALHTSSDFGGT